MTTLSLNDRVRALLAAGPLSQEEIWNQCALHSWASSAEQVRNALGGLRKQGDATRDRITRLWSAGAAPARSAEKLCSDHRVYGPSLRARRERWALVMLARRRPYRVLSPAWRAARGPRFLCSRSSCRFHLSEMARRPIFQSCALVLADRGGMNLDQIGKALGWINGEGVRQIEERALKRPAMVAFKKSLGGVE